MEFFDSVKFKFLHFYQIILNFWILGLGIILVIRSLIRFLEKKRGQRDSRFRLRVNRVCVSGDDAIESRD